MRDIYSNVNGVARRSGSSSTAEASAARWSWDRSGVQDDSPVPDAVAGAEAPHVSPHWSPSHVTLMRTSFVDGATTFAEFARIPLADRAEALEGRAGA